MDRISIYILNKFRWGWMNIRYGFLLYVILLILLSFSLVTVGLFLNYIEVFYALSPEAPPPIYYMLSIYLYVIISFILYYLIFVYLKFYRAGTIWYLVIAVISLTALCSIDWWLDKLLSGPHLPPYFLPPPRLLAKAIYMLILFLVFAVSAIPIMVRVHQWMRGGNRIITRFGRAHSAIEKLAETKNAPPMIRAYQWALCHRADLILEVIEILAELMARMMRTYRVLCHNRRNILCSLIFIIIKKLTETKNDGIKSYKSMYDIYPFSCEYDSGIEGIKNLLIHGVDLSGFSISISNTKLNLNELLDRLSLSIKYYLFYGEAEQMEAVKMHMVRMAKCFDENYNIRVDELVNEILRMYSEINIFFDERNIEIIYPNKLIDRIRIHLQKIIPLIVVGIIYILIKLLMGVDVVSVLDDMLKP